jgi:hypothetical protein
MTPFERQEAEHTLAVIETVVPKLYALLGDVTAEEMDLKERDARCELNDRTDFQRLDDLRLLAMQIRDGIEAFREGTDARLAALLQHPDIQALPMRQIGIVTLESLRDWLQAKLAQPIDTSPWPRPFRYIAKVGKHRHDGRLLKVGDVVDLTETQAEAWRDKFVPVAEESVPV